MNHYLGLFLIQIGAAFIGGAVSAWYINRRGAGQPLFIPMDIKVNLKIASSEGKIVVTHNIDVVTTGELSNEILMQWLDREGMVAMPKGVDFGKKAKS